MNAEIAAIVNEALTQYGAKLDQDGFIEKNGRSSIKIVVRGKRLRFEGVGGMRDGSNSLMSSGPINTDSVCNFVEKFWFWKKGQTCST